MENGFPIFEEVVYAPGSCHTCILLNMCFHLCWGMSGEMGVGKFNVKCNFFKAFVCAMHCPKDNRLSAI